MIWTKDGRDYTCTQIVTPGNVELKFHGHNDVKPLLLSRFGYQNAKLVVGAADEKVTAAMSPWSTLFFQPSADASPEVQRLDTSMKAAFEETFIAKDDPFPCVPIDFGGIGVAKDKASQRLALYVMVSPRSSAWRKLRLGSRTSDEERRRRLAQTALEGGIAEVLARFCPVVARFPEIQDVAVTCLYATTEAFLDTQYVFGMYIDPRWVLRYGGVILEPTPVYTRTPVTVVSDRRNAGTINFTVPVIKIPATEDKKTITEAVLAAAEIEVMNEKR